MKGMPRRSKSYQRRIIVTKICGYSQPYLLSIYDPANTFIDMGSKAHGIKHIQASFKNAYQSLANLECKREGESLCWRGRDTRKSSERRLDKIGGEETFNSCTDIPSI